MTGLDSGQTPEADMRVRREMMPDGRYLIYYSFGSDLDETAQNVEKDRPELETTDV